MILEEEDESSPLLNEALRSATEMGWVKGVLALLQAKADVNANVKNRTPGISPMHLAARNGHLEAMKCLVENKACVNSITAARETPLHFCARDIGSTAILRTKIAKESSLSSSLSLSTTIEKTVKYLVHCAKANVQARDVNQQTVLHVAARTGNLSALEVLLQRLSNKSPNDDAYTDQAPHTSRGVDERMHSNSSIATSIISVFDKWGRTCLHWAVLNQHYEATRVLLKAGSRPKLKLPSRVARRRTRLPSESALELALRLVSEKPAKVALLTQQEKERREKLINRRKSILHLLQHYSVEFNSM
eukprot:CAMPEP_0185257364 /NCGR_PEP_ID=MMETSP1359-20130426/6423_1 /TAXON_ID=552665 /ORGANISM="Bigelowiella longifila, Strain CCMP242" /LENGTH=303 /DNA_ID=CAMNT_0027842405 /DNA_START=545 /DNA_END=1456 /DNA_ORIENTATION=+